ncbi:hypothetical protein Tco_0919542 [Tanacetum coccineum]
MVTIPSNTVTNTKEGLEGITTRSGIAYKRTTIPKVVERETEVTKDMMHPTNNGSTEDVQPSVVPVVYHESISEPVNAPVRKDKKDKKKQKQSKTDKETEKTRKRVKTESQIKSRTRLIQEMKLKIKVKD